MSLINDALKRATEAQAKTENIPAPELKFRGVDPRENRPKRSSWILPSTITVVVLAAVFVVWQCTQRRKGEEQNLDPKSPASHEKQTGSLRGDSLKVHAREDEPLPGAPLVSVKPVDAAQSEKVAIVAVSGTTIQETTKNQGTDSVGVGSDIPKAASPKLQAIVYNPASPSAIISGKTVFVGDRIGLWKVLSVGRDSATLVRAGETNVLKLGE